MLLSHFIGKGSLKLEPLVMLDTCNRIGHPSILSLPSLALMGSFSFFKLHLHEPFLDLPFECNHCAPFSHSFPSQSFCLIRLIFHLPCPFSSLYPQRREMDTGTQEESRKGGYCLLPLMFIFHRSFKDSENISATRHIALSFCFCFVILYSDRY